MPGPAQVARQGAPAEGPKLLKEFRVGRSIHARLMERMTESGSLPYLELSHTIEKPDGTKRTQNFVCRLDRFEELLTRAKEVLRERQQERKQATEKQAEPAKEQAKEQAKQWHALVAMDELTEKGGKVRVVKSFDDINDALTHRAKNKELALYTEPFSEKPAEGKILEVREGPHLGNDFKRQFAELRWQQEQGKYYGFGVWYDKGSSPSAGQLVNFTTGHDYRGYPEEHRVTPLRAWEPGESRELRYIIYEMHDRTPGLARIVGQARVKRDAVTKVKELDAARIDREKAMNNQEWSKEAFGPKLRQVLDQSLEL